MAEHSGALRDAQRRTVRLLAQAIRLLLVALVQGQPRQP
jgi:hypothetical protein